MILESFYELRLRYILCFLDAFASTRELVTCLHFTWFPFLLSHYMFFLSHLSLDSVRPNSSQCTSVHVVLTTLLNWISYKKWYATGVKLFCASITYVYQMIQPNTPMEIRFLPTFFPYQLFCIFSPESWVTKKGFQQFRGRFMKPEVPFWNTILLGNAGRCFLTTDI